jgi:hypothetical protein
VQNVGHCTKNVHQYREKDRGKHFCLGQNRQKIQEIQRLEKSVLTSALRSGFSGATGSLLLVSSDCTGGQAASGTQSGSVIIESISCRSVSIGIFYLAAYGNGKVAGMEFLLVSFPGQRVAQVINRLIRNEFRVPTNRVIELEAGVYWVTLDGPNDFTPTWRKVILHATAINGPMEAIFEPTLT